MSVLSVFSNELTRTYSSPRAFMFVPNCVRDSVGSISAWLTRLTRALAAMSIRIVFWARFEAAG